MTHEEYVEKRNGLIEQAQNMINDGKVEDANSIMDQVKGLDEQYQTEATASANLAALQGAPVEPQAPIAPQSAHTGNVPDASEDPTNTMEYRKAFMDYVLNGHVMNASTVTTTTEGGAVIPTVLVDRIIEKLLATGMILPRVTQTAYKGGVSIPVSLVKPTAEWVKEGADATGTQLDVKKANMVTFSYYKLKCKVAVTLEMDVMSISSFENMIVNNVSEAMTYALENAIINGTGSGQPKGILAETAPTGQAITTAKTGEIGYKDLINCEAALPLAYENGAVWLMNKKTFMDIEGMVDSAGQPIARVNYGLSGAPERTILGRTVVLNDYMPSTGTPAVIFNMADYILNTNLNLTVKTYEDNETDDQVTKAIMLVDGKVVDTSSLVTLTLKTA